MPDSRVQTLERYQFAPIAVTASKVASEPGTTKQHGKDKAATRWGRRAGCG